MLTTDEVAFKRRQLASLREAHPTPAPHVQEVMDRLERETADAPASDGLADQLAAAHAIIAGLEAQLSTADADRAALRIMNADLEAKLATKPKTKTAKRKA